MCPEILSTCHANNVLTGLFPEEGYCPALDVLDDCAAVREAGLHLDMEALYMCNRHQMCYTCVRKNSFYYTEETDTPG